MLNKALLASALSLCLVGNALAQDEESEATGSWEISADLAVTSDYVFRGVSQSQEDPALQAGLNFDHETGFYLGLWGSSVDFTPDDTLAVDEDGANVEIDAFIGYGFDFAEDWSGDVQVVHYLYPGSNAGFDYDYSEFLGAVSFKEYVTATIGYSNDVFNSDEDGVYLGLSGNYELPWGGLSLTGEVGTYDIDKGNDDGSDFSYSHWGLGVSKSWGPVTTSLNWADTDNDGENFYGDIADARVYFTVEISTGL